MSDSSLTLEVNDDKTVEIQNSKPAPEYENKRLSCQDDIRSPKQEYRNSLSQTFRRVSAFYDSNSRILTSNYAGAEDDSETIKEESPRKKLIDEVSSTSMNRSSRYQELYNKGELGFWATLFTFIKVNIVAGFLFLPAGFELAGWLFSVVAIFIISGIMIYCNISISECTDAASTFSFSKIGYRAMGKFGYYIVEFGIAISQICFPCSYANLITQILNKMLNNWLGNDKNYFLEIAVCLAVILIPLCLLRNINKLSSMHFIGDIAVLATVVTLAYESIYKISKEDDFDFNNVKMINSGWAKLLGMAITSLEGIGIILPIKENMKDKKQFNLVIIIGTIVVSLILGAFPLIMYLCYQKEGVQEIILTNLDTNKIYIQLILILLMFSVLIVYPVQLFPAFIILENIFFKSGKSDKLKRMSSVDNLQAKPVKGTLSENLLRVVIVLITVSIGVYSIKRFDTMLSLVGCGICTPVALILPSIFHYRLFKSTQSRMRNFFDLSCAILGITLSLTVLVFTVI
jgi:proton-coupled amino acid transporter